MPLLDAKTGQQASKILRKYSFLRTPLKKQMNIFYAIVSIFRERKKL